MCHAGIKLMDYLAGSISLEFRLVVIPASRRANGGIGWILAVSDACQHLMGPVNTLIA